MDWHIDIWLTYAILNTKDADNEPFAKGQTLRKAHFLQSPSALFRRRQTTAHLVKQKQIVQFCLHPWLVCRMTPFRYVELIFSGWSFMGACSPRLFTRSRLSCGPLWEASRKVPDMLIFILSSYFVLFCRKIGYLPKIASMMQVHAFGFSARKSSHRNASVVSEKYLFFSLRWC